MLFCFLMLTKGHHLQHCWAGVIAFYTVPSCSIHVGLVSYLSFLATTMLKSTVYMGCNPLLTFMWLFPSVKMSYDDEVCKSRLPVLWFSLWGHLKELMSWLRLLLLLVLLLLITTITTTYNNNINNNNNTKLIGASSWWEVDSRSAGQKMHRHGNTRLIKAFTRSSRWRAI